MEGALSEITVRNETRNGTDTNLDQCGGDFEHSGYDDRDEREAQPHEGIDKSIIQTDHPRHYKLKKAAIVFDVLSQMLYRFDPY